MRENVKHIITLIVFSLFMINGQNLENENINIFEKMDKSVCRIYYYQNSGLQTAKYSGTGINIRKQVHADAITFVFTANHVIDDLFKFKNSYLKIYFTNIYGKLFWTGNLGIDNIIWHNRDMDAAIIGIPKEVFHEFSESDINWTISTIERITTGNIGQDIYMLGKRWTSAQSSISIFKKGIISAKPIGFPHYEDIPLYIIDKMANKGMSGGLIFNDKLEGIALISSYVLEQKNVTQLSDDLTVGIPLLPISQKLDSIIFERGENIIQLLGY